MNIKDINELRNNGRKQEAYEAAKALWMEYREDRYVRTTMAWCLKDRADEAAKALNADLMVETLEELVELRLEEIGEGSMTNRFSWDIFQLLRGLNERNHGLCLATAEKIRLLLPQLHFVKPHKYYSILADVFAKLRTSLNAPWEPFVDFMDWFGFDNFEPADYERIEAKNGKSIPSVVERVHSAYYKALVARMEGRGVDREKVRAFVDELTKLNEGHPEYQYTLYHKTLLLLKLGDKEAALETVRPFVKKKQNDFWVWEVLSETVDDAETKLSCCCRALTCRTDPKFLGKLHLKTARIMHELGLDGNARAEIRAMHKVYEENEWKMPKEALEMVKQDWYQQAVAPASNLTFYQEHLSESENLLFLDNPEVPILITHYNAEKHVCNFVTEKRERGFFFTKGLKVRFAENCLYRVRMDGGEVIANKATRVVTCKPVEDVTPYVGVFFKKVEGELKVMEGKSFGFVGRDVFVDLNHLKNCPQNGDYVVGTAVIAYNMKKETWGWRAIALKRG